MAVIPKAKVVQLRVEQEFFDKLSHLADVKNTTVSAMIRGVMGSWLHQVEQKARKDAEWAATLESRRLAASVSTASQKPPVEAIRAPQTVSERRKAEKLAKQAKAARREDRY